MAVDYAVKWLPRTPRWMLELFNAALILGFLLTLAFSGYKLTMLNWQRVYGDSGISYAWVTIAIPVGSFLMSLEIIIHAFRSFSRPVLCLLPGEAERSRARPQPVGVNRHAADRHPLLRADVPRHAGFARDWHLGLQLLPAERHRAGEHRRAADRDPIAELPAPGRSVLRAGWSHDEQDRHHASPHCLLECAGELDGRRPRPCLHPAFHHDGRHFRLGCGGCGDGSAHARPGDDPARLFQGLHLLGDCGRIAHHRDHSAEPRADPLWLYRNVSMAACFWRVSFPA